jgi:hypothetical protein
VAFGLCTHIDLPFSNPWDIVGGLAQAQFNPATNVLRFLLFVCAPALLLVAFRLLPFTRSLCAWGETDAALHGLTQPRTGARLLSPFMILSCLFCAIMALNSSTYHDSDPTLDAFHEGESLGTSITVLNGGIPYKDVAFTPGAFMEPLRSVVAFRVFGRSIGAARTLDSILTLLSFLTLFAFLWVLYEGRHLWVSLTLMVLLVSLYCGWLFIISRDLMTYAFLLVAAVLLRSMKETEPRLSKGRSFGLVLFSFLPLATMMYSVDRGFYLTATWIIMLPLIVLCFGKRSRGYALLLSALGAGLAVLLAGVVLHWEFRPFIDFSIMTVPQYWELMDGFVFPFRSPRYLVIVLIISWNAYWVFAGLLTAFLPSEEGVNRRGAFTVYLRMHLIDICVVLMSLFFFRNALGRCDWEHVRYSSGIAYILFCYLMVKYWLNAAVEKKPKTARTIERVLLCVMVAACLAGGLRIGRQHLLARDFPFKMADAELIPNDYQQALSFLKANLSQEDDFLALTSEPAWYYMLNRPCPIRFPIVWYGEPPFYQQEIVEEMKTHKVKIILYADRSEFSNLDGISASERLPVVYAYIRDHYRPYRSVAGMDFWIRKS